MSLYRWSGTIINIIIIIAIVTISLRYVGLVLACGRLALTGASLLSSGLCKIAGPCQAIERRDTSR